MKKIVLVLTLIILFGGWYFFRGRQQPVLSGEESGDVKGVEKISTNLNSCFFPVERIGLVPVRKAGAGETYTRAHYAVALDVDSDTILFYQNGQKRTQVASLTKIMTAVLAVDKISDLSAPVTITAEAVNVPGTRVGCPGTGYCTGETLKIGEKVRANDLLKAALMNSTNDAATALGIHVSGTEDKFAELMNKKSAELGLKDTHFCRPSGLEYDGRESECYSTAYDMARLVAYSVKNPKYKVIWEYFRIPQADFYSVDGKFLHHIGNTNKLLESMPGCLGAKTGFTPLAGQSLFMASVDSAGKNPVVMVLLDDPYRFDDARALTDWIYTSYDWQ